MTEKRTLTLRQRWIGLTHEKSTVMGMVDISASSHMAMERPNSFGNGL